MKVQPTQFRLQSRAKDIVSPASQGRTIPVEICWYLYR